MRAFLDNLGRDLRYTGRSLFRQPLLVTAAALSIGVAVAANAVIFGLANDLLLSAPSARQPEQLAYIRTANSSHVSYPQWKELDESGALAGIAGYQIEIEVNWTGPEQSISMIPLIVTPNFFDLLGVPIAQGRGFTTAEALPERQAGGAVISHTFWQNRLGGDPAAVGRVLTFNGRPYTVLGILPAGLRAVPGLGIAPEVYLPISRDLLPEIDRRDSSAFMLIGRLRPDQALEEGRAALQTVVQRLDKDRGVEELGGVRQFAGAGGLRRIGAFDELAVFFAILGVAVALVLAIACANVAGLLLSRGVGQGREAALRAALGASRSRLVQQQLTEAGWLALLGTGTGILLSVATGALLTRIRLPLPLPIELHAGIDVRLLMLSLVILVSVTLLSGLLPAVRLTRPSLLPAIKSEAGHTARRRWSLRPVLVTSQVAVALVLLLTAFLFVRNLSRAQEVDPGFDTAHTLVAQIGFVEGRHTPESRAAFLAAAVERLRVHPGIREATYARGVPLTLRSGTTTGTDLKMADGGEAFPATYQSNAVGPSYFSTMGIRLIAGREFLPSDRPGSPQVAIVSEEFVRRYLGGRSPLGRQLLLPGPTGPALPGRDRWRRRGREVPHHRRRAAGGDLRVVPAARQPRTVRPRAGQRRRQRRDADPRRSTNVDVDGSDLRGPSRTDARGPGICVPPEPAGSVDSRDARAARPRAGDDRSLRDHRVVGQPQNVRDRRADGARRHPPGSSRPRAAGCRDPGDYRHHHRCRACSLRHPAARDVPGRRAEPVRSVDLRGHGHAALDRQPCRSGEPGVARDARGTREGASDGMSRQRAVVRLARTRS